MSCARINALESLFWKEICKNAASRRGIVVLESTLFAYGCNVKTEELSMRRLGVSFFLVLRLLACRDRKVSLVGIRCRWSDAPHLKLAGACRS